LALGAQESVVQLGIVEVAISDVAFQLLDSHIRKVESTGCFPIVGGGEWIFHPWNSMAPGSRGLATCGARVFGGGSGLIYIGPFGGLTSASATRVGWTVGGGLEYAITNNWSVRGEYRYTDFGHPTIFATSFDNPVLGASGAFIDRHFTENRVQVGSSYKFDTAVPTPVVAKY
jgi:opacity protein-like surface antigen